MKKDEPELFSFIRYKKLFINSKTGQPDYEIDEGLIISFYAPNTHVITHDDRYVHINHISEVLWKAKSEDEAYEAYPEYFI
jgi:hypothetical protein